MLPAAGRFRRTDRILRSAEFRRVLEAGERVASRNFVVFTLGARGTQSGDSKVRLGITVSLGVFRELDRAEAVRDRIQALGLGFEPAITDRTRPGALYWADLTLETGEEPDLAPLQRAGRIIRLEQRVCDEPGG